MESILSGYIAMWFGWRGTAQNRKKLQKAGELNKMTLQRTQEICIGVFLYFFLIAAKTNPKVFQTPPEIKVLKGDTAQINCSYSGGDEEQMRIKWMRNSSEQLLCQQMKNKHNSASIPTCTSRFQVTLDTSANSTSLLIDNVNLNDIDIYFCEFSIEIPPPILTAKGEGTWLKVEARPTVQLTTKAPSSPDASIQLICTSVEFYPGNIQVSWFRDGELITNGTEDGHLYSNSDGSFSMASFLNLSVSDWSDGGNYSCQVNHSTLSTPIIEHSRDSSPDPVKHKKYWTISTLCSLLVLIVAVICFYSISKKKVPLSVISARPESEQTAKPPVRQQLNKDNSDDAIYSLLGQHYVC
ncbi:tyrosine-protein phosphatase non-receptor type substrate 1-like [Mobula hypostoma]|uniref:tyrosine-protein phosphatase non-receptor type substrate 1-like n=1 Tax=Mobula hypostoma TaxID=723540 RepID=UPI002FC3661C